MLEGLREKILNALSERKLEQIPRGPMIESDFNIVAVLADAGGESLKPREILDRLESRGAGMTRQNLHERLKSLNDAGYVKNEDSEYSLLIGSRREPKREVCLFELFIAVLSGLGMGVTGSVYPGIISVLLVVDVAVRYFLGG